MRTALLTAATMVAFAANSLLCRMALGSHAIDPASFAWLRLTSGALVLLPLARWSGERREQGRPAGSWASAVALFTYAIAFSLAYVSLPTGAGALILFGAVQVTMIAGGLRSGERPRAGEWLGLVAAMAGLVALVAPGVAAPDPAGALLMAVSGIAWGVYSLRGRGARAPVSATAGNFARTVPLAIAASALSWSIAHAERTGVVLALASGTIASGLGYVLWYKALAGLTATRAAIVQLAVPVLAAFGGVALLSERLTARLGVSSVLILGGIAVAVWARRPARGAVR